MGPDHRTLAEPGRSPHRLELCPFIARACVDDADPLASEFGGQFMTPSGRYELRSWTQFGLEASLVPSGRQSARARSDVRPRQGALRARRAPRCVDPRARARRSDLPRLVGDEIREHRVVRHTDRPQPLKLGEERGSALTSATRKAGQSSPPTPSASWIPSRVAPSASASRPAASTRSRSLATVRASIRCSAWSRSRRRLSDVTSAIAPNIAAPTTSPRYAFRRSSSYSIMVTSSTRWMLDDCTRGPGTATAPNDEGALLGGQRNPVELGRVGAGSVRHGRPHQRSRAHNARSGRIYAGGGA